MQPGGQQLAMAQMQTGRTMQSAFKFSIILTVVISVIVAVPLLLVFVDWSAITGDGNAPEGGYCEALVRCCKYVHGSKGNCDQWEGLPAAGCESAYDGYKQSAEAQGKTCE